MQEKIVEQSRKQREYERKNVTTDSSGNVIVIKGVMIDKLNSDFLFPRTGVKDYVEPIKTPTEMVKLPDKKEEIKNNLRKNNDRKSTMMIRKGILSEPNNIEYNKPTYSKENKQIFQPVGSNFE